MEPDELRSRLRQHQTYLTTVGQDGEKLELRGQNLRGVDLAGADLREAELFECDLTQANLRGAWLSGAWLLGANLGGADLRDARLDKAGLAGVDARGASFRHARLVRTSLDDALVSGATFDEAYVCRTSLEGLDLRDTSFRVVDFERSHIGGLWSERTPVRGSAGTVLFSDGARLEQDGGERHLTDTEMVDWLHAAGAPDIDLFDLATYDRDEWHRWRSPLSDALPPPLS